MDTQSSIPDSKQRIQTFSGGTINPINPDQNNICIEDIAHALSMQCRFGGHVKRFMSVAQHSVLVSRYCDRKDALWAILHDASEAYLTDITRPIKHNTSLGREYLDVEARMMSAICLRFNLSPEMPVSVKQADDFILRAEAQLLLSPLRMDIWVNWPNEPVNIKFRPVGPIAAEKLFLKRFALLTA